MNYFVLTYEENPIFIGILDPENNNNILLLDSLNLMTSFDTTTINFSEIFQSKNIVE